MSQGVRFSIKYKFVVTLVLILLLVGSVFFALMTRTIRREEKIFVTDLNSAVTDAAIGHLSLALSRQVQSLPTVLQRIYESPPESSSRDLIFRNLPAFLSDEILGATVYDLDAKGNAKIAKRYSNAELLKARELPQDILKKLDEQHPFIWVATNKEVFRLMNRSLFLDSPDNKQPLSVLTFVMQGAFSNDAGSRFAATVDILQDSIRRSLLNSELAELLLISGDGNLLSHPDNLTTVEYAFKPFPHPVVPMLEGKHFSKETVELNFKGEPYLCTFAKTGLENVFLVAQVKRADAFRAFDDLVSSSTFFAGLVLYLGIIASILFARTLTANLKRLGAAAQAIGSGDLSVRLNLKSRDEVNLVATNFNWMAEQLSQLLSQSKEKGRMEQELKTAALVQATLLSAVQSSSPSYDLETFYLPASELGGDFWDVVMKGNKLTAMVGDATGHGAAAAIVTAVAKSCLSTLGGIYSDSLMPEALVGHLNRVIHQSCRGKILMTLVLLQLDLSTGELLVCNAGHEFPLLGKKTSESTKDAVESLMARGERLGYSLDSKYETLRIQLSPGDTILLYTDGLLDAPNPDGKTWGERAIQKAFAKNPGSSPADRKKDLVLGLQNHANGTPNTDDVTFLLMRWNQPLQGKATSPEQIPLPQAPRIKLVG